MLQTTLPGEVQFKKLPGWQVKVELSTELELSLAAIAMLTRFSNANDMWKSFMIL